MPIAKLDDVVVFPKGFPSATTGILLAKEQILITGHENGFVMKWDIKGKTQTKLHDGNSPIRTIAYSGGNEIAIGCDSGALVIMSLDQPEKSETIRKPMYDKFSRVWRAIWVGKDRLIITSTYGEITSYYRISPGMWGSDIIRGHSDSIFAIASSNGKYLLTGDYRGNMRVWENRNDNFHLLQRLEIQQTVQDACWYKDEGFVVINRAGRVYLYEKESAGSNVWQNVYEIDIATGTGNCVRVTDDGKTILAGTDTDLIQFDRDSQQVDQSSLGVKRIFTQENMVYVLTAIGLQSFERREIEALKEVINYKFVKIGLLGHTGTGKTTLCNYIVYNKVYDAGATFGKRVWNWILPKDNDVEKRIILSDYAGQEAVLETFLRFLSDSDMILIFFKQTDNNTFEKALHILERIRKNVKSETKIMFVQTFIDDEMKNVPEADIEILKKQGKILDNIKISPKKNIGLEDFRKRIMSLISWEKARTMIKSPYSEGISKTFAYIQEKGIPAIPYGKFKEIYQETINGKISDRHLNFLLKDYTNQGIIEYYPGIIDLIIFNDEMYNKLVTNIPIYVEQKKGIVSIGELQKEFGDLAYLRIIDEVYTNSKVSIRNGNLRIFPDKLSAEPIKIPDSHKDCFKGASKDEIKIPSQYVEAESLIDALSEISLQCVGASQKEGIFSWEKKACIYYTFSDGGDGISGRYVRCTFYIGGDDESKKKRLGNEFTSIIKKLYETYKEEGPPIQTKKKD
jgi:GTPase SAR1 family protein